MNSHIVNQYTRPRGGILIKNNYKQVENNFPPAPVNFTDRGDTTPSTDDPTLIHNQQMGVYPDKRDILGAQQLPFSSYPQNMTETNLWQTPQRLTDRYDYISVYSGDRDRNTYPQPNYYRVGTGTTFRNIKAVEIVQVIYPATDAVKDTMYLNLVIPELGSNYFATNRPTSDALAIITPGLEITGPTYSYFKARTDGVQHMTKVFRQGAIKASLDKITIEWRNIDGTLFNFGVDTVPPIPVDPGLQNQITIKVHYWEPDTQEIGRHNP